MTRVLVACDHRGVALKDVIIEWLKNQGYEPVDMGPPGKESVDYPMYAFPLAERVAESKGREVGILICGWGNGMAIAANKIKGIRAALCMTETQAKYARRHNDANVLVLAAEATGWGLIQEILIAFLTNDFEAGRHEDRVQMIRAYENK